MPTLVLKRTFAGTLYFMSDDIAKGRELRNGESIELIHPATGQACDSGRFAWNGNPVDAPWLIRGASGSALDRTDDVRQLEDSSQAVVLPFQKEAPKWDAETEAAFGSGNVARGSETTNKYARRGWRKRGTVGEALRGIRGDDH